MNVRHASSPLLYAATAPRTWVRAAVRVIHDELQGLVAIPVQARLPIRQALPRRCRGTQS